MCLFISSLGKRIRCQVLYPLWPGSMQWMWVIFHGVKTTAIWYEKICNLCWWQSHILALLPTLIVKKILLEINEKLVKIKLSFIFHTDFWMSEFIPQTHNSRLVNIWRDWSSNQRKFCQFCCLKQVNPNNRQKEVFSVCLGFYVKKVYNLPN